jgi:hypothetical protein
MSATEYDIRAAIRQLPYKVQQAVYRTRARMGRVVHQSTRPEEYFDVVRWQWAHRKPKRGDGVTLVKYGSCRPGKNKQDRRDVRCQLFSCN